MHIHSLTKVNNHPIYTPAGLSIVDSTKSASEWFVLSSIGRVYVTATLLS